MIKVVDDKGNEFGQCTDYSVLASAVAEVTTFSDKKNVFTPMVQGDVELTLHNLKTPVPPIIDPNVIALSRESDLLQQANARLRQIVVALANAMGGATTLTKGEIDSADVTELMIEDMPDDGLMIRVKGTT